MESLDLVFNNESFLSSTTYLIEPVFSVILLSRTSLSHIKYFLGLKAKVLMYIHAVSLIPSTYVFHNKLFITSLVLAAIISVILRAFAIDLINLFYISSPLFKVLIGIFSLFLVLYIIYIEFNLLLRLWYMLKFRGQEFTIVNSNLLSPLLSPIRLKQLYYIKSCGLTVLSLLILYRIYTVTFIQQDILTIYSYILIAGLVFSIWFISKVQKDLCDINISLSSKSSILVIFAGISLIGLYLYWVPTLLEGISKEFNNKYYEYVKSIVLSNMSGRDSSTLNASTTNLRESNSIVRETQYKETSRSRAESHADGARQESNTTTHTESYGDAIANSIATSKTYEVANQSTASTNPPVIITSTNVSPSANSQSNPWSQMSDTGVVENNPMEGRQSLNSSNESLHLNPLIRLSTPVLFADPEYLSYTPVSKSSNDSLPASERLKSLWTCKGICPSTLKSELLFSSKFTYLNGSSISDKVLSYYMSQFPGYPLMTKIPGSHFCKHVFYMDLNNRELISLIAYSKAYIDGHNPVNTSIQTLYKLSTSHRMTVSTLKYPGFLEKWYHYNNILDKLICSDSFEKFVSKEDTLSILRARDTKQSIASKFVVTWLNGLENQGTYELKFNDLEIKLFYDLGQIKLFLSKDLNRIVDLDYFSRLKNNMILNDLINNYIINYSDEADQFRHDTYLIGSILESLGIRVSFLTENKEFIARLYYNLRGSPSYDCSILSSKDFAMYKNILALEANASNEFLIRKERSMTHLNILPSSSKINSIKRAISTIFTKK